MDTDDRADSLQRRQDDRDKYITSRVEALERAVDRLTLGSTHLEQSVATVKLEQSHLKELMDARLRIIEKNQEFGIAQMNQIAKDIVGMGSDVQRTPAGQILNGYIEAVRVQVLEHAEKISEQSIAQRSLTTWQNRVDGVLYALKWMGAGGVAALIITLVRLAFGK